MKRLLEEKAEGSGLSEAFVTHLEEKLVDLSVLVSQVEDKRLRKLLEFLYEYAVEKPDATPWNRTIVKYFDLDPENEILRDDLRRLLYAVRLMKEISADLQRMRQAHKFR